MTGPISFPPAAGRVQVSAFIVGLIGLALCAFGYFSNSTQFYRSYLTAFLFWTSIAIGCTILLMIYHMTGGGWGYTTRRMLESGSRTFPLLAIFFLPIIAGMKSLYRWTDPVYRQAEEVVRHKQGYLNEPFFLVRSAAFFVIWILLAFLLSKWSAEQDHSDDPGIARRMTRLSGPGLVIMAITVTIASVDWIMSLDAKWFSTIYGLWYGVGGVLGALALMTFCAQRFAQIDPMDKVYKKQDFHDLGNLTLAFVLLWAYVSFSQFLIIWSGNLPEETTFYVKRMNQGWQIIAAVLLLFHFALPLLILLSRQNKRQMDRLATLAVGIFLMRYVDLFWVVRPSFDPLPGLPPSASWMDLVAPIGMGGIWVAVFLWGMKGRPMVPVYNPQGKVGF